MNGRFKAVALLAFAWALLASVGAPAAEVQVSMGDSYSSGEGAPPYDPGTARGAYGIGKGNDCHRSGHAWPRQLEDPVDVHLACSGAVTKNFFEGQKKGWRAGEDDTPQLDRLEDVAAAQSVSRVYVTIGGNDAGFAKIVALCLSPRDLFPCLEDLDERKLPRLRGFVLPNVVHALTAVRMAAPQAQVVLVGYPDAIPPATISSETRYCGRWLDDDERRRLPRLEQALDSTLAVAARAAGADYISVRDVTLGRGICSADPWINPITFGALARNYKEVAHPNPAGQTAIADAVDGALASGRGVVKPPPAPDPTCRPIEDVALIVDDSSSVSARAPSEIREEVLRGLIEAIGGTTRTLGATEFGADAGPLFGPALVGTSKGAMLGSLTRLDGDGFADGAGPPDLATAFAVSAVAQPDAKARVLLVGEGAARASGDLRPYTKRTYVIGLDTGTVEEGGRAVLAMSKLASRTGGAYFPLEWLLADFPTEAQQDRVKAVVDSVDALLACG